MKQVEGSLLGGGGGVQVKECMEVKISRMTTQVFPCILFSPCTEN